MSYLLRKMVKHVDKGWRYKYLEGIKFDEIPDKVLKDNKIKEFVRIWGNGVYEILDSGKKRDVKKKFRIKKKNFRAIADSDGKPIILSTKLDKKPISTTQPESLSKEKTSKSLNSPQPNSIQKQATKPMIAQSELTSRLPTISKSNLSSNPALIKSFPSQLTNLTQKSPTERKTAPSRFPNPKSKKQNKIHRPMQNPITQSMQQTPWPKTNPIPLHTQPIEIPYPDALSVPQAENVSQPAQTKTKKPQIKSTTEKNMEQKTRKEKQEINTFRCNTCDTPVNWGTGGGLYICPVCEEEYNSCHSCGNCGKRVNSNAYSCPHCGNIPEKGENEHKFFQCIYCKNKLIFNSRRRVFICSKCENEYQVGRACPICITKVSSKASECPECGRDLQEREGQFLYLICPIHGSQAKFNKKDLYHCIKCLPELGTEDDDIYIEEDE